MTKHTPQLRIEMDSINDVPHVWIDGKRVDDLPKHGLTDIEVHWHTATDAVPYNHISVTWCDGATQKVKHIDESNLGGADA
jgi:hypothetical protein